MAFSRVSRRPLGFVKSLKLLFPAFNHYRPRLAVFLAALKAFAVGAPLVPGFLMRSPLPAEILARLAWIAE
jgi:hypothetical protein